MSSIAEFKSFSIRAWRPIDRAEAAEVIGSVLAEYGLSWEPDGADRDVLNIEDCYLACGGEFWVVEQALRVVGTAAYYPIDRPESLTGSAVEIRKMYLRPEARGQGLGRFLLTQLETRIADRGFTDLWIETASVLQEAVILYEKSGYEPATGVETARCDRIYLKRLIISNI
jgi:putative acetyltransferase